MRLGLATAVSVDATVVRLVLVLATMELLGKANWQLPQWLDRRCPPDQYARVARSPTRTRPDLRPLGGVFIIGKCEPEAHQPRRPSWQPGVRAGRRRQRSGSHDLCRGAERHPRRRHRGRLGHREPDRASAAEPQDRARRRRRRDWRTSSDGPSREVQGVHRCRSFEVALVDGAGSDRLRLSGDSGAAGGRGDVWRGPARTACGTTSAVPGPGVSVVSRTTPGCGRSPTTCRSYALATLAPKPSPSTTISRIRSRCIFRPWLSGRPEGSACSAHDSAARDNSLHLQPRLSVPVGASIRMAHSSDRQSRKTLALPLRNRSVVA
jgi:hypothetical protein